MFKSYLATALNNLLKHKLFSFLNITGLSIGLAACILIGLYVQNELSYDRHWQEADRLYRLTTTIDRTGGRPVRYGANAFIAAPALKAYFPDEIEAAARVMNFDVEVAVGDARFNTSIPQADQDILELFDFEEVAGSLQAALETPGRVALSEESAVRLFGTTANALGRTMTVLGNDAQDLTVMAVYRLPAGNSLVSLPALTLLDESRFPYLNNWLILANNDYVKLRPGTDVDNVLDRLVEFADQRVDISALQAGPGVKPSERVKFGLVNISDVYLQAPDTVPNGGNKTVVLAFSVIALLVLLIGCTNFTILSTAKATQRAREVAMRKAIGARRSELVWQFLGESCVLVLMAMVLALMLVEMMLPVFSAWVGANLQLEPGNPLVWLALLVLALLVSVAGGLYPAFVLSHFRPAITLKANRSTETRGSVSLRNSLVTLQFAISIALMIATAVVYLQVQYTINRDPGYNRDNLLTLNGLLTRPELSTQLQVLQERIGTLPGVTSTSLSGHQPMQRVNLSTVTVPYTLQASGGDALQLPTLSVDQNFFATYEIPVIAGRTFDNELDQPASFFDFTVEQGSMQQGRAVINAAAARYTGFANPEEALGRQLTGTSAYNNTTQTFTIIGVVGDTQFFSLRSEPRPELYLNTPYFADVLTVRYEGGAQRLQQDIAGVWNELTSSTLQSLAFVDQLMAQEFAREQLEARILISFSLLAILIACLGLFGSAAFNVERRTKEIGIRKVMGAEVREIVTLLLWQFSKPVLLANIIAWPLALWAMLSWLQRFPYRIDQLYLLPLCILAGVMALAIAWLTVAANTVRVATARPVLALRYE